MDTKQTPRRGFTLIELLVVVSIIALLISILLPSLGSAKRLAEATSCASRMKGLGQATLTYLAEYENTFPVNGLIFPKEGKGAAPGVTNMQLYRPEMGALWSVIGDGSQWMLQGDGVTVAITSAIGGDDGTETWTPRPMSVQHAKLFMCPSDQGSRGSNQALTMDSGGTISRAAGGGGYWSYGVNTIVNSFGAFRSTIASLNGGRIPWNDPLKMTQVQNPGNFIIFLEEDAERSNFNDEVVEPPAFRTGSSSGGSDDSQLSDRHNKKGNIGFGDGHVEPYSAILFNQVPAGGHELSSPYTRMFFPDYGEFGG